MRIYDEVSRTKKHPDAHSETWLITGVAGFIGSNLLEHLLKLDQTVVGLDNFANVSGFLNTLVAAWDAGVQSFTYAASSSTYGDHPALPKVEEVIGKPLSPYAVTKYVNELYADVFARTYGFKATGLRYFNVFGQRQDPDGAYAAVIPKWAAAMIAGEPVYVNGDGETSRDFCFIENAVQANVLAATAPAAARGEVYNVAVGDRTTLNILFESLAYALTGLGCPYEPPPVCVFQTKVATDSRRSLPPIPRESCH